MPAIRRTVTGRRCALRAAAPIYTQGTQADFPLADLPDGRYLISVLADGYKLDGAHFTMPIDTADPPVAVRLQVDRQTGLPDATIQAAIFEDNAPTNGAPDVPAEHGLAGLKAGLTDILGDIQTNVYGNPLCSILDENGDVAVVGSGGNCFSYCYVVDNGLDIGIVLPAGWHACQQRRPLPDISPDLAPGDPTGLLMWPLPGDGSYSHPSSTSVYNVPVPSTAVIEGKLKIPHLGTNRYAMFATPPDGQTWIQTTTLEGNHDWDAWVMEGATGLDTEFVVAGEPFPADHLRLRQPTRSRSPVVDGAANGTSRASSTPSSSTSRRPAASPVSPVTGSAASTAARSTSRSTSRGCRSTTSTTATPPCGLVRATADGSFDIPNVPDGTYTLTWWDEPQDYILDLQNVTVVNGETVDMGILPLTGWWTQYDGYVFNDTNRNGIMDWTDTDGDECPDVGEGELGVPNYGLTLRRRENSLMDRGTTAVGTDACGHYYFESGYPMTQWLVMEAYNDLYYTTGVTYQADNQPTPTTVLGAGVDVSTLPIIGLSGRMDWGVHSYDAPGTNGHRPAERRHRRHGVVRHHPQRARPALRCCRRLAARRVEPRCRAVDPGRLPDRRRRSAHGACDPTQRYQLDSDGSYSKGKLINTYLTETWAQPGENDNANGDGECIPRDVDGDPLTYPRQASDHQQPVRLPRGAADGRAVPEGLLVGRRQLRLR